jgi:RHS repeat-associated protein
VKSFSRAFVTSLALGLATLPAFADPHPNTEGGVNVNQIFQVNGIDNVNLFNGALTVSIPLGISYPVNGPVAYQLHLVANSNAWDFWSQVAPDLITTYTESAPSHCSNAGMGWRVSLGAVAYGNHPYSQGDTFPNYAVCADLTSDPNDGPNGTGGAYAVYEGPDGAQHLFYATLHPGDPDDFFNGVQDTVQLPDTQNVQYTRDGSYLRLKRSNPGTPAEQTTIEFPDGMIHTFGRDGRITQISDRLTDQQGMPLNWVKIAYLLTNPPPNTPGCPTPQVPAGASQPESSCWQITDSQNRTQWVYFRNDLPFYNGTAPYDSSISRVVLLGVQAAPETYTFNYTTPTLARGYPAGDPAQGDHAVPLLQSVQLPDGTQYGPMGYFVQTAGGNSVPYSGFLTHLGLPTFGSLEWTYQFYAFPTWSTSRAYRTTNQGVATRTAKDASGATIGTWTYSTSSFPAYLQNTMQDPLGNSWIHYFSIAGPGSSTPTQFGPGPNIYDYGRPYHPQATLSGNNPPTASDVFLSEQVVDAQSHLKRTTYVRYERDVVDASNAGLSPPNFSNNNGRMAQQNVVYDDGAQAYFYDQEFDGVGHYRNHVFGGTFAANNPGWEHHHYSPDRWSYTVDMASNTLTSTYIYLPPYSPWLLNLEQYEFTQKVGHAELQTFCHDANTGFLLRRRTYTQHTNDPNAMSASDLLAQFVPDAHDNVGSEIYFGGDNSPVATNNSDLCMLALPAAAEYQINHNYDRGYGVEQVRQYVGTGFYSVWRQVDPSTGLVLLSQDTAGIPTSYEYAEMGRLRYILPRDGAWTQFLYNLTSSPVSLTVEQQQNGAPGTILAQTKYSYDGLGRMTREDIKMADNGTSSQLTYYDALDRKVQESELGSPNNVTLYLSYDPFGRVGLIRPPDSTPANGFAHDVTMSYNGVQTVTRSGCVAGNAPGSPELKATTIETYDRFGRLATVAEASAGNGGAVACGSPATGGQFVTTTYGYDEANRLTAVTTPAAGTTQTRTFTYDGRGFLTAETHPETAGAKTYSSYDSRGHYHRRADGVTGVNYVNDLSFTYDAAERPRLIYNTLNGPNCNPTPITTPTCIKQFTYDGPNGALGRLYQASRYNHPLLSGTPYADQWTYTYAYLGLDGRVSQRTLQHTFNGQATGNQESFAQAWTYTQLGKIDTETYPDCAPTFTKCTGTFGRAVQNAYSNGYLTAVNGFTGGAGITYYPNGMVNSVTHVNGVTALYGLDPYGLPRPASITVNGPSGTLWSSGPYAYDGAGNVKQVGLSYYLYDLVSRLTTAQIETNPIDNFNPAFTSQVATYDAFGNVMSLSAGPRTLQTPVNASTNQLTGGAYDGAGNLKSWNEGPPTYNIAHYDYDELNQLKHFTVGSQEWLYMYDADDERVWTYQANVNPRFDRWTLRGLDGKVKRTFELTNYQWTNSWTGSNLWEDYVYRDGLLLSSSLDTGERRHMDVDHLGTVRLITNRFGLQPTYHVYLPYGEESTATFSAADTERMKFTGHERDLADATSDQDDLDYMHARHYSMLTGRFLSVDPVHGLPDRPQTWNRFSYVVSNPESLVDPTGLQAPIGDYGVGEGITVFSGFYRPDAADELFVGSLWFQALQGGGNEFSRFSSPVFMNLQYRAEHGDEAAMDALGMPVPGLESVPGPIETLIFLLAGGLVGGGEGAAANIATGESSQALVRAVEISLHATERMAERGVTSNMVKIALRQGERYYDPLNKSVVYVLRGGLSSGKSLAVATNALTRSVNTVMTGAKVIKGRYIQLP